MPLPNMPLPRPLTVVQRKLVSRFLILLALFGLLLHFHLALLRPAGLPNRGGLLLKIEKTSPNSLERDEVDRGLLSVGVSSDDGEIESKHIPTDATVSNEVEKGAGSSSRGISDSADEHEKVSCSLPFPSFNCLGSSRRKRNELEEPVEQGPYNHHSKIIARPMGIEDVMKQLQLAYIRKLRPLEALFRFDDFEDPAQPPPSFHTKPLVLLLGPYSVGKTTAIRSLLNITMKREGGNSTYDPGSKQITSSFQHSNNNLSSSYQERECGVPSYALATGFTPTTSKFRRFRSGDSRPSGCSGLLHSSYPSHLAGSGCYLDDNVYCKDPLAVDLIESYGTAFVGRFFETVQVPERVAGVLQHCTLIDSPGLCSRLVDDRRLSSRRRGANSMMKMSSASSLLPATTAAATKNTDIRGGRPKDESSPSSSSSSSNSNEDSLKRRAIEDGSVAYDRICEWFAARCDCVLFMLDGDRLELMDSLAGHVLDKLRTQREKLRILLNKVDLLPPSDLLRASTRLHWSLSKVLGGINPPRAYMTSFGAYGSRGNRNKCNDLPPSTSY